MSVADVATLKLTDLKVIDPLACSMSTARDVMLLIVPPEPLAHPL